MPSQDFAQRQLDIRDVVHSVSDDQVEGVVPVGTPGVGDAGRRRPVTQVLGALRSATFTMPAGDRSVTDPFCHARLHQVEQEEPRATTQSPPPGCTAAESVTPRRNVHARSRCTRSSKLIDHFRRRFPGLQSW